MDWYIREEDEEQLLVFTTIESGFAVQLLKYMVSVNNGNNWYVDFIMFPDGDCDDKVRYIMIDLLRIKRKSRLYLSYKCVSYKLGGNNYDDKYECVNSYDRCKSEFF